jgi:hypothetical protein
LGAIDEFIANALLTHSLNLLRLAADARMRVLAILLTMSQEMAAKLSEEDVSDFGRQRMNTLLREAGATIDRYYSQVQAEMLGELADLVKIEASFTANTLAQAFQAQLGMGLPPETYLEKLVGDTLIKGAASKDWWIRQKMDTQFRFANAVRQGAAQGETNSEIVARIVGRKGVPGVMDVSRRNAYGLVQTSIQAVANAARLETFKKNADVINCLVWMSTLDSHTCLQCAERDLAEYGLEDQEPLNGAPQADGGPGAIHFACRCAWSTQTKTFAELGIDLPEPAPSTRASRDGQVSGNMTFSDWLAGKDAAFRKEYLGPGRAELYESGKITLNDLMDQRGNPLTLAQLRTQYQ